VKVINNEFEKIKLAWIKYRSLLHDSLSGLPTLPLVLEDLRKHLSHDKRLALILIGLSERIESIYGWQTYEEIFSELVERSLSFRGKLVPEDTIFTITEPKSTDLLLFIPVSEEYDSKKVLEEYAIPIKEELERWSKEVESLRVLEPVFRIGYAVMIYDPMMRFERIIYGGIKRASEEAWREEETMRGKKEKEMEWIIKNNLLQTLFQPIVDLENYEIHGYEALNRAKGSHIFPDADSLFSFAVRTELLLELERLCRLNALLHFKKPDDTKLFINISAKAVYDPELTGDVFVRKLEEKGLSPGDVVFEITERLAIVDFPSFEYAVKRLRDRGFMIAIDDMGAGYSSLHTVAEIKPDYLKYDMALVRNIDKHLIKKAILETLVPFARKINAKIIAEGVETVDEYKTIKESGVDLAQGFLFSAPKDPPPTTEIRKIWEG